MPWEHHDVINPQCLYMPSITCGVTQGGYNGGSDIMSIMLSVMISNRRSTVRNVRIKPNPKLP